MTAGPWWMDPEEILGRPPQFPVTKPKQFDREDKIIPPDLTEQIQPQSSVVDAYVRGVVSAVSERLERAAEAMLVDPEGRGVLALEDQAHDGNSMTFRVITFLHPDVPWGNIHHHKVESIETYVRSDLALSEGRARLIE